MAGPVTRALLSTALLCSAMPTVSFAQTSTPSVENTIRLEGFTLRTGEENPEAALQSGEDSVAPSRSDPGRVRETPVRSGAPTGPTVPAQPEPPLETREPAEPPAELDFDLFEGPEPVSTPVLAPAPAEPAGAAEPLTGARAPERVMPPMLPFRATGPVRSPTFAPAGAEDRLNRAVADLRPSFPPVEADPFAPDGIAVGRFRLFPVLQQEVGVTDNLDNDQTETSGAFSQTTLSARFLSDWARHQADINASAAYRRNFGGALEEDPNLALDARLQLDLASETTALLRGAVSFAREDAIQADPQVDAAGRPDVLAYSLGADLSRPFGPALLAATGDVVREERQLDGGSTGGDFTTATFGLRAGYDIGPALRPFAEGSLGRRFFDDADPFSGLERDSLITALRGGMAFDFGEKVSGELAVGYAWNSPREGALPERGSPTLDAALNWSPKRGTDVVLTAVTFFDPEQSNLSTSTVYETAIALRHRASARTEITSRVSAAFRDREGAGTSDDRTYAGEAELTYWLNRSLALTALARHERFKSDVAANDYSANSVRVGMRLQR